MNEFINLNTDLYSGNVTAYYSIGSLALAILIGLCLYNPLKRCFNKRLIEQDSESSSYEEVDITQNTVNNFS